MASDLPQPLQNRILVTGSTGFLGRALIAGLVSRKYNVSAFMRNTSSEGMVPPGISIVKGELSKVIPLKAVLERFEIVIHCAAEMNFAPKDSAKMYQTNVDGTSTIARAAALAGIKQFIYISSTETVAPTLGDEPADEESVPNAFFEYGKSKILAEQEVVDACEGTNTRYTIIRPTGILGGNSTATCYQLFWGANFGLFFFVPGSSNTPQGKVTFTHISDIVKGIILSVDNQAAMNQKFILSTNAMDYESVIRLSCSQLNRVPPLFKIPYSIVRPVISIIAPIMRFVFDEVFLFQAPMIDQMQVNRIYSSEKAQKLLGWKPDYTMQEAIVDTIKVQKNVGLLRSYTISPVGLVALVFFLLILLKFVLSCL